MSGGEFWDQAGRQSESSDRAKRNWSKAKTLLKMSQISSAFKDSSPLATVKRSRERKQALENEDVISLLPRSPRDRLALGLTVLAIIAVYVLVVYNSLHRVHFYVDDQITREMVRAKSFHEQHPIINTSVEALHASRDRWHQDFKMLNDEVEDDFTISDIDDQLRVFFNVEIMFLLLLAYIFTASMIGDSLLEMATGDQ
jgi:hypothetical protein